MITLETAVHKGTPSFIARYGLTTPEWSEVDLELPGVYAWSFRGHYVYVGKSINLGGRLRGHLRYMNDGRTTGCGKRYQAIAAKHGDTARVVVLANGQMDGECLAEQERFWLDFFRESLDKHQIVNSEMNLEYYRLNRKKRSKGLRLFWKDNATQRQAHSESMSNRLRALFKDEAYKEAHAERVRQHMKDPARKQAVSKAVRKHFSDPANREAQRQRAKAQWQDPVWRAMQLKNLALARAARKAK